MQAIRYGHTLSGLLEQQQMETSNERRRRKLELLCKREGGYRAVAERADVNPAALDQVLKGVLLPAKADGSRSPRALGDSTARAIESAYPDLGVGWFDVDDRAALDLTADEIDMVLAYRAQKQKREQAESSPVFTTLPAHKRAVRRQVSGGIRGLGQQAVAEPIKKQSKAKR